MKVFYCCYGSAHSSVVAASIHLGMLSERGKPSIKDLINLPHYDKTRSYQIGIPFFMGTDEKGRDIYIIGMGGEKQMIKRAIISLLYELKVPDNEYVFVDTLHLTNFITKIGGVLSRRLGIIFLGRPLTAIGIRMKFFDFVNLVKHVKNETS